MENQIPYKSLSIDEISKELAYVCERSIEDGVKPFAQLNDNVVNQYPLPLGMSIAYAVAYNKFVTRINNAIKRYKEDVMTYPTNFYKNINGVENV